MSYIPNCREDEFYNVEKLNATDKRDIFGYDWAIEMVIDNLFDNTDFFEDDVIERFFDMPYDFGIEYEMTNPLNSEVETRDVKTYGEYIRYKINEWAECHRNELIVSILDGYEFTWDDSEESANKDTVNNITGEVDSTVDENIEE